MLKGKWKFERGIIMERKLVIRIDKGKFIGRLASLCVILFALNICCNFIRYPEECLTSWKYQLENDLAKGNQEAIQYYNKTYIANGKQLFGDKYIVKDEYLNMATVVGYETSDNGVMLITIDGEGYFIEKENALH